MIVDRISFQPSRKRYPRACAHRPRRPGGGKPPRRLLSCETGALFGAGWRFGPAANRRASRRASRGSARSILGARSSAFAHLDRPPGSLIRESRIFGQIGSFSAGMARHPRQDPCGSPVQVGVPRETPWRERVGLWRRVVFPLPGSRRWHVSIVDWFPNSVAARRCDATPRLDLSTYVRATRDASTFDNPTSRRKQEGMPAPRTR